MARLEVPAPVLLLLKNGTGIGGCFGGHVRETNGHCRSQGEQSGGDHQGIAKQETEEGEGCSCGGQGEGARARKGSRR